MRITANSFMPVEAKIIIDGKSYTGEEFNRLVEALRAPSLTDDQQVVLEWLKSNQQKENYPTVAIANMLDIDENNACFYAIENLSIEQEFQVLAAFAEWGLSTLDN